MLSRRGLLATAALWPLPAILPARAAVESFKVGLLPFGTGLWEAAVIKARGLDAANGFSLDQVKFASNDAARIAFQGDSVDAIIGDLVWAGRLRSEGRDVKYQPYSTTEGALMLPGGSPIKDLKDLAGKRLGVAGGPLDKNWLLLKAQAREAAKLDLETGAQLAFGAPPLLTLKLETGELDAALLYWQNCARLEAKGFRKLLSADDIMRAFGAVGPVALIGYLFDAKAVADKPEIVKGFSRASAAAKDALANEPATWELVRPLMAAENDATYDTLKRDFLEGIPRRSLDAERADGERIFATLARLGGDTLVGGAKSLPPNLYVDAAGNG